MNQWKTHRRARRMGALLAASWGLSALAHAGIDRPPLAGFSGYPVALDPDALDGSQESGDDNRPRVAYDSTYGTTVAVWEHWAGSAQTDYLCEFLSWGSGFPNTQAGSEPVKINGSGNGQLPPNNTSLPPLSSIASNNNGKYMVVWESTANISTSYNGGAPALKGTDQDILCSVTSYTGGTSMSWSSERLVNSNGLVDAYWERDIAPRISCLPKVGTARPYDIWVAVWAYQDYKIYAAYSIDDGVHWSARFALDDYVSTPDHLDRGPAIAVNPKDTPFGMNGLFVIAWQDDTDHKGRWAYAYPSNSSYNSVTFVKDASFIFAAPPNTPGVTAWGLENTQIAANTSTAQQWTIVYQSVSGDNGATVGSSPDWWDQDIYAVTWNGGGWSSPVIINPNSATDGLDDIRPNIACDNQPTNPVWFVSWCPDVQFPVSPVDTADRDIVASYSVGYPSTWSNAKVMNQSYLNNTVGSNNFPAFVAFGPRTFAGVWETGQGSLQPPTGSGSNSDLDIALIWGTLP